MKKTLILSLITILLAVGVISGPAAILPPPTCPGCAGADCNQPCGYEWGSDLQGEPLECPADCHCWYFTDATGAYVPVEDPETGKEWEGWCYHEPDPDVPEFTGIGLGIAAAGLIGYIAIRKKLNN
ncbi:hypothetical protein GF327_00610 [Candidatus Woesearchaeota archaeon]|nr:hypothetical protein [Candidatus Woesearchaeota archaeon]